MPNSLEELTPNQVMQLAALTHQLANSPDTREEYLRLVKRKNPNVPIPELDAKDEVLNQIKQLREDNDKLRGEINDTKLQDRVEKKRLAVMTKHSLTEDQMTVIEKLMIDKKLPDYDTAVEFQNLQNRVATPTGGRDVANPEFTMPDANVWAGGIGNKQKLDRIARDVAYKAMNEARSGAISISPSGLGRAE